MGGSDQEVAPRTVGRYLLFREIGHGGMATVHLGRLHGPAGFARTVAIKRLHAQFARDPEFVSMFLDEARLAARIQHPNVVSVLDVVASEGELFLVMDYVHGESLFTILRTAGKTKTPIPRRTFVSIITNVLYGLDAAHEARSDHGAPLEIVHRDVSPHNVLLGIDGAARVLDFGVAKASHRIHWSQKDGQLKGKLGYMAPEQITSGIVDRRADVYSTGVMLWEGLVGKRLFRADDVGHVVGRILAGEIEPPSKIVPSTPKAIEEITMKALSRSPSDRFASAREMAIALERAMPTMSQRQVGEWVQQIAGPMLQERAAALAKIEGASAPQTTSGEFPATGMPTSEPPESRRKPAPLPSLVDKGDLTPTKQAGAKLHPTSLDGEVDVAVQMETSEPSAVDAARVPGAAAKKEPDDSKQTEDKKPAESVAAAGVEDATPPIIPKKSSRMAALVGVGVIFVAGVALGAKACAPAPKQNMIASAAHDPAPPASPALSIPPPSAPIEKATIATTTATDTNATASADTAVARTSHPTATSHHANIKPKPNCNPPYTIDATGVKVPKPQCL